MQTSQVKEWLSLMTNSITVVAIKHFKSAMSKTLKLKVLSILILQGAIWSDEEDERFDGVLPHAQFHPLRRHQV